MPAKGLRSTPPSLQAPFGGRCGGRWAAPHTRGGPYRSPDWVMSRRQVSICTSKPRFMLHISMYSCRCRFISFLAVASSSCGRGRAGPSGQRCPFSQPPGGGHAKSTARQGTQAATAEGSDLNRNQIKVEGPQYTIIPSSFPDSYRGMQRVSAPGLHSFNRLVRATRKRNVGKECSCGQEGENRRARGTICGWPCCLPGLRTWPASSLTPPIIPQPVCVPH